MKESGIKLAVLALALIGSSAASASTTVLNGKGFDIVYSGGTVLAAASAALAAPSFSPLSLGSDGKTVIFSTSGLTADGGSQLKDLSFSIVLDPGYTFSNLSLSASGLYALTSFSAATASSVYSGVSSTISAGGSSLALPSSSFSKTVTAGSNGALGAEVGSWSLNSSNSLASTSFANAPTLSFTSMLLLGASSAQSSSLAQLSVQNYSLQVGTNPVPVPEPEQWMMMLAGVGMLGTIIGRRSRS